MSEGTPRHAQGGCLSWRRTGIACAHVKEARRQGDRPTGQGRLVVIKTSSCPKQTGT
ncbi:MAG: hypothetical protein IAB91_00695 [Bacteroidetes bacterium]|uniref:Uncharacterized protein n=1 Tax=Candidatus Cryptobacteroides faecigallinarum TaxID=2840763 RepID=A0A9D9NHR2_9BACT|nr:hypothetical protein [Candidatus Cryptobacteroides faecigallinarum]